MAEKELKPVIDALSELGEDNTVPKNVRIKVSEILISLQENVELCIKASKALSELDEIANDSNLQSYTRTRIWEIVSMLEKL